MKKLASLLLAVSTLVVTAQTHRIATTDFYTGDPTGTACTVENKLVQSTTTGFSYVCKSGQYIPTVTGADSNGNFTVPGKVAAGGVALPSGAPAGTVSGSLFYSTNGTVNLKAYGAKGDAQIYQACSITSGTSLLSCGSSFTSSQVGKWVAVRGAGASSTATLRAKILSVASGQATLDTNAGTTTTGSYYQQALIGTDDTTAINSALTALTPGKTLEVPQGMYYVSSQLTLDSLQSVTIKGHGNARQFSDFATPQFIFTASSGSLIHAYNVIGVTLDSVALTYWDSAYNGNLIDIEGPVTNAKEVTISNALIGGLLGTLVGSTSSLGSQAGAASALIYLHGVYDINFEKDIFQNAQTAILGPSDNYTNANSIRIRDSNFQGGFAGAPIQVSGQSWSVEGNTVEPYNNHYVASGSLACGFVSIVTPAGGAGNFAADGLFIAKNTVEDATAGNGICVDLAQVGNDRGTTIIGNDFTHGQYGVRLNSNGHSYGPVITGNTFDNLTCGYTDYSGTGSYLGLMGVGNTYLNSAACAIAHGGNTSASSALIYEGNDINGNVILFTGQMRTFGQGIQDFGTAGQSTCANGRWGIITDTKSTSTTPWSGTGGSDRLSVCMNVGGTSTGKYQWVDVPITAYAAPVNISSASVSITSTNLQFNGAVLPAGFYKVEYYAVATAGTGTAVVGLGWHDSAAAQTFSSSTLSCSTTTPVTGSVLASTDGVNNLTYSMTLTGSCTYALRVQVTRMN